MWLKQHHGAFIPLYPYRSTAWLLCGPLPVSIEPDYTAINTVMFLSGTARDGIDTDEMSGTVWTVRQKQPICIMVHCPYLS